MSVRPSIAVAIPCYNEELTVRKVVQDFRAQLPDAAIFVFDNRSTDRTAEFALEAGAVVIKEPRQGKGHVVRAIMERLDADLVVMVDGDDTYPAEAVHELLAPALAGDADMVVGARLETYDDRSFRPLHVMGNNLVRYLLNTIFGTKLTDILSGYRVFTPRSRRYVPVVSSGFEIETELTAQVLAFGLTIVELPVAYRGRPEGSYSKLNTFSDGFRVLWKLFSLFRDYKPLTFFGIASLLLALCSIAAGIPPVLDYIQYRFVYRVPLAVLAAGLGILATLSLSAGVILHQINWRFRELHSVVVRAIPQIRH